MEEFLELAKYIVPSIIVLLTALLIIKWFLKHESNQRRLEFLLTKNKEILPIRLSAYERITLFLERISAESIIIREQSKTLTAKDLQAHLLSVIRQEYEHNIAVQVYMPPTTWSLVKNAKEEMVRLINISAGKVKPTDPSILLGKTMLELYQNETSYHFKKALDTLKADVQNFLN